MKTLFFGLTLFLITNIGIAQGFEAYAIGGITFSQIDGDNLAGYNKVGFTGGAATNFILKNGLSVQQELVYYQRGSRATSNQLFDDIFTYKTLNYIDFSFLINKKLKERWLVQGGAGAGKLIGIKTDDPNDQLSYYAIDLFPIIGGGYFITESLLLNVRLQYTLISADKFISIRNNTLALSLRYRFINKD